MNTKRLHNKNDGRMFYHMIQSFKPEENLTPQTAHEIALKMANQLPGFEILVAACIPSNHTIDEQLDNRELVSILNDFLAELSETQRKVFVCRYWYCDSIAEIAQRFARSESNVKMTLLRTREKLKLRLKKEGIFQ